MKFEFYVLNYDINKRKVEMFNIFSNVRVQEEAEKAVRKYLRAPKKYKHISWPIGGEVKEIYGFEGLCEEIRTLLMWQEWSRCQYEISVGDAFETDVKNLEKWDCYKQALPNIEIITREIIYQYKKGNKK